MPTASMALCHKGLLSHGPHQAGRLRGVQVVSDTPSKLMMACQCLAVLAFPGKQALEAALFRFVLRRYL